MNIGIDRMPHEYPLLAEQLVSIYSNSHVPYVVVESIIIDK